VALVYFLAGDSYPKDRHVETALARRLSRAGVEVVTQDQLGAPAPNRRWRTSVSDRAAHLQAAITAADHPAPPFVIGRSSGAIVATTLACRIALAGVICLSYPFRPKGRVLEPDRFAHLADCATRTLIIQGDQDPYGGLGVSGDYALSPRVSLRLVAANHRLELDERSWDETAGWILDFMAEGPDAPAWPIQDFDEGFYLETHADVAEAVGDGRFTSGLDHFEQCGRGEARAYRLLPPRR
jgi:predicted alpha/beta-hydrolase family hydrolase